MKEGNAASNLYKKEIILHRGIYSEGIRGNTFGIHLRMVHVIVHQYAAILQHCDTLVS